MIKITSVDCGNTLTTNLFVHVCCTECGSVRLLTTDRKQPTVKLDCECGEQVPPLTDVHRLGAMSKISLHTFGIFKMSPELW